MFYHIFSTSVINIVPFTPHIELGPPSQIIIQYSHHSFQFVQKALCHWQISPLKNWPVATNLRLLGIVGMEWNIIQAIKSNIGNFLASSSVRKTLRKRKIVHGNLFNISVLFSLHKAFFLLWKVKVVCRYTKMLVKTKTQIRTKMSHIY